MVLLAKRTLPAVDVAAPSVGHHRMHVQTVALQRRGACESTPASMATVLEIAHPKTVHRVQMFAEPNAIEWAGAGTERTLVRLSSTDLTWRIAGGLNVIGIVIVIRCSGLAIGRRDKLHQLSIKVELRIDGGAIFTDSSPHHLEMIRHIDERMLGL